jgi:hypothetical protein
MKSVGAIAEAWVSMPPASRRSLFRTGRHERHRLAPGGNRQITGRCTSSRSPVAGSTETRAYLQRKEAEGKSRMEAMRRLERHLARHYH